MYYYMASQKARTQQDRLIDHLTHHGLARANELARSGVSATTIARSLSKGDIVRVGRGLYQLANAELDVHATLAEVSKLAPKGIICLVSALAFHDLTDQIPRKTWIAIGTSDWAPKISYPPIRPVRFCERYFSAAIESHKICSVDVPIYSPAKSIADAFRNPKLVDRSIAIESLKSALADRRATPAAMFETAREFGAANIIKPYLEALTANG